jgi:hypothetical protein
MLNQKISEIEKIRNQYIENLKMKTKETDVI